MKDQELGRLYYLELGKIVSAESQSTEDKITALLSFLQKLFFDITRDERIHFTTIFSRIAFASHKYRIDKNVQYFTFLFRKEVHTRKSKNQDQRDSIFRLGVMVNSETIHAFYGLPVPENLQLLYPSKDQFPVKNTEAKERIAKLRVVALEDDPVQEMLLAKSEDYPERLLMVRYNDRRNESFKPTINAIRKAIGFPVTLNLIDVIVDKEEVLTPGAFVAEPDYLVDVTSVAECFKENNTTDTIPFLMNRFLPKEPSVHILLGNIANYFLDELIANPDQTFESLFSAVFTHSPFAFVLMSDAEVKNVMEEARLQYINIRKVIREQLQTAVLDRKNCFLEPSFYSETYGLQGRLDLLHLHPDDLKNTAIIELKSGKPFKPNGYDVGHNHYTQTLLYDLMIKSAYGSLTEPQNFILYSKMDSKTLRYAPAVRAQQYEAINQRNQLIAIERAIMQGRPANLGEIKAPLSDGAIYSRLSVDRLTSGGFLVRDVEKFERVYKALNERERDYFHAFAAMIATEHQIAKTGLQGVDNVNGMASLWLNSQVEKEDSFQLLKGLIIAENHSMADDPILVFSRTAETNPLANFRAGDVAVLSLASDSETPENSIEASSVLQNQVFKGTVLQINSEKVWFRLRAKQFNQRIFTSGKSWNIEPDMYDSSFLSMYRGLFALMAAPSKIRNLLLTLEAPLKPAFDVQHKQQLDQMTEEQKRIFGKMISSKDYFLLWGPPGTGKTSVMLRQLSAYLLEETNENVLFLAYTNRAVDEICEAIESNGPAFAESYLRIGSRYATHPDFHDKLLEKKMEGIRSRAGLRELIEDKRIFVGTVASMNTKPELFQLKKFDTIVIDEASQILEPQIVGLLVKIPRFILIGDHRQLPAVVTQSIEQSAVNQPLLTEIGLVNLRNSFFERLYLRCVDNQWDWAYDQLSRQGRMHSEIVDFPSRHFYEENLHILPEGLDSNQTAQLDFVVPEVHTELELLLATKRKCFVETASDTDSGNGKVNVHEARKVVEIIESLQRIYNASGRQLHTGSIGVITPFRAQIAQILHLMQEKGLDTEMITVDTVERYQGGSRDIILISLCSNSVSQLQQMVSVSSDGTDRKLNVALTRAKKQLIVIGNEWVLSHVPIYHELIKWLNK